jgi:hypothetical protein
MTAWGGEETFSTMLRSNESLDIEAPLVRRLLGRQDPQMSLAIPLGLFTQADDVVE